MASAFHPMQQASNGDNREMQRALRKLLLALAATGLLTMHLATSPAVAQPHSGSTDAAGLRCRAACAAGPHDDRGRLLACLQGCGVAVQRPPRQARGGAGSRQQQARLSHGTGLGRQLRTLPMPTAPEDTIAMASRSAVPPTAYSSTSRQATSWGAIYAAPAPFQGLGVVAGQRDRLAAHGRADSACAIGAGGLSCKMLVEFTSGCAAAARASHEGRVSYTAAEIGVTRDAAARAALNACQTRARTSACRVVQTVCAG